MLKKQKLLGVTVFVLFTLAVTSCAPGISVKKYEAVKGDLDKAKDELGQTKNDLNRTNKELIDTKTALAEANSQLAKVQTSYFEDLLKKRRSVRDYANSPLTKDEAMKLLWAGQGLTAAPKRTAPSANVESPPIKLYLVVGNVENLLPSIYKYMPERNDLSQVKDGDMRDKLLGAAGRGLGPLGPQVWIKEAAIDIIVAAIYEESVKRYAPFFGEERGKRYVLLEAGHATQNILLMATALDLGALPVGGFNDEGVKSIAGMLDKENPVYIVPVSRKK